MSRMVVTAYDPRRDERVKLPEDESQVRRVLSELASPWRFFRPNPTRPKGAEKLDEEPDPDDV